MIRFTAILLSAMSLIAFGLGAPATYDQRQDGDLNFSGKLENILIVIASPSGESSKPPVDDSEIAAYLSLLGGRDQPAVTATQFYDGYPDNDSPKRESDEQERNNSPKETESPVGEALQQSQETSTDNEKKKIKVPKPRSLWGQVKEVVDNKEGRTLKKELAWGQDQAHDEGGRSTDHNEVGLLQDHYTLLGDGIEDCGPERRRNSYGICQPYSEE